MNGRIKDITGQRFGRLVALRYAGRQGSGRATKTLWLCQCDCGNKHIAIAINLRHCTRSCGCLNRERTVERNRARATHGMTRSPEYRAWHQMLSRCTNPNLPAFRDYGGRGIQVHAYWYAFEAFIADMGLRPGPRHTLERKDNNGDYEPENCVWATWEQQNNNRRSTVVLEHDGKRLSITQWAREIGVSRDRISIRLKAGKTIKNIVEEFL